MKRPSKQSEDEKHEAKARKLAKALRASPEWKDVHVNLEAKDNVPLQVMNQVLREQARRKIN